MSDGAPTSPTQALPQNDISNIRNMVNFMRNANNPKALIEQAFLSRNPQLQQAVNYIRSNGGNPKTAFYKLAEERGIDPKTVENLINGK